MKLAIIEALSELDGQLFTRTVAKNVLKAIPYPIYKTREITRMSEDNESKTEFGFICSRCSTRYSVEGSSTSIPASCPECGNDNASYYFANLPGLSDDFCFSKNVKVVFDADILPDWEYARVVYRESFASRPCHASDFLYLEQRLVQNVNYFILRKLVPHFGFDTSTGQKYVYIKICDSFVIFDETGITHVKENKVSRASIGTTFSSYWQQHYKGLVADDDTMKAFLQLVSTKYPDVGHPMVGGTITKSFYISHTEVIDELVRALKATRPATSASDRKQQKINQVLNNMPERPHIYDKIDRVYFTVQEIDGLENTCTFSYTCPDCGTLNQHIMERHLYNQDAIVAICPHCNKKLTLADVRDIANDHNSFHTVNVVQNMGDGVVIYDCRYRLVIEGNMKHYIPDDTYRPASIFVINKDFCGNSITSGTTLLRKKDSGYSVVKTFFVGGSHHGITGGLHNIATNFNCQWAGLEVWNNFVNVDTLFAHILLHRKYPVIEKIAKLGYKDIMADIISSYDWVGCVPNTKYHLEEKDLASALKLSNGSLRILREMWLNLGDLNALQLLYAADPHLTLENYRYIKDNGITPYRVVDICRQFGLSIHDILSYIERVRVSQCLLPSIAINEWSDYLKASETIGCDLTDRKVKYPAALRTEHDKVIYKKGIIENAHYEETFKNVTSKYGEHYSFKGKQYLITYPKTLEDLFEEGRVLHHCVGSYGDRVKDGTSIILFLRSVEKPDCPYFTIEVDPNYKAITQFYGFSDKKPNKVKDRAVIDFVREWAIKHEIEYTV